MHCYVFFNFTNKIIRSYMKIIRNVTNFPSAYDMNKKK